MPTSWSDLTHEGKNLRYINNRIMKRIRKAVNHDEDNEDRLLRLSSGLCTVINTQKRIAENIRYEQRLEEIEAILRVIPPETIALAKQRVGV